MSAVTAIQRELNLTTTDNGALSHASTMDSCLDLFGKLAACRRDLPQAIRLFRNAYRDQPELAVRILFYTRDIRGGQGERAVFRAVISDLAEHDPSVVTRLLPLFAEYGRYDDLLCLDGTSVWDSVLSHIRTQLNADVQALANNEPVSLLAKWLPSANASSRTTVRLARAICSYLGWTEREYRKVTVSLRTQLRIIEQAMCSGNWSSIEYSHVPAKAMNMYRQAFKRRDADRFQGYLDDVASGAAKVNAGTLFPYDLVRPYLNNPDTDRVLDLQWDALPNYFEEGNEFNGLVVADVSGSMTFDGGLPLAVSISLAMYIAERNTCEVFRNKFLTFSSRPSMVSIEGDTLGERVRNLSQADWGGSTNLQATFQLVLDAAVRYSVPASDMPSKLIIVSDMQFDAADCGGTNFQAIRRMYSEAGYECPQLVFWNVNAGTDVPFTIHESGATLVSGCSPAILRSVLNSEVLTAVDLMNDAVVCDRYEAVGAALADATYQWKPAYEKAPQSSRDYDPPGSFLPLF